MPQVIAVNIYADFIPVKLADDEFQHRYKVTGLLSPAAAAASLPHRKNALARATCLFDTVALLREITPSAVCRDRYFGDRKKARNEKQRSGHLILPWS
ncbi:hypothetical protein EVAR_39029_1 [Eumeta japonica]|uniref:Uncharacterized protein n=1 Tax=Eumeta variegata TaxID=151549 RepID=A0A4C1WRV8_EUMVA|nr:hypothetical protein EVAR_39029_1 [Eumeta japonica]